MKYKYFRPILAAMVLINIGFSAVAADLTVAYQTIPDPSQVAQADGAYEKATGLKIDWRKFDAGAEVIAAVASGGVQIAYLGSSPYAAAVSQKVPVETLLIASKLGASEALVARNGAGIATPADLVGKKVATPFVSTSHYSLLAALKHWNIDAKKVQILNLNPPAISAAWQRGDIDAAYTWDPALGVAKASGKVLISSGDLAKLGAPTFDVWLVRKDFAEKHPEAAKAFAKVTQDAYARYRQDPQAWLADKGNIDKLVKITGANAEDIPGLLQGNTYPLAEEQRESLGAPTVKAIGDTAAFLKEQGRIDAVLPDYTPYVTAKYVPE
ncbi:MULTISPECIES: taurine ABC transporter substrate-binding protein [Brenneria]|uniref:Taurine ABC transporter substrate-binding protein n=1 Tax=Brenneria nigrifluens DSM 30175 = ATCC 13028 TaxID=1121120 RepID=A0A2U1UFR8_9GAMM|nr:MULTISPECIES: taurine ABC transporter substrate-binding protein [Brenneria]EHD20861.1 taurine ABC transporter, periplasmic binding protein [Brenneria sp. EniD312]PWC20526.1 taurine ABC transporter substrate-binding protein [Brenneria nigrifluens DSM 30175 = ATCC 13028]QCR04025.1 taurine ABC transporter substrate-binding protein [Brenneria nigrifluens DSM 30175 = ATCC 13028]